MHKYEFLMLANPAITGDETSGLEKNFEKLVRQFKGSLISFDRWGKCRLAYAVKRRDYGVYYMARFEMDAPQEFLKEIKLLLDVKYNDLIVRATTVKIDPKKTFTDYRPESVEDIPTRNVDQFLRENKMEGLIGKAEKEIKKVELNVVKEATVTEAVKEASASLDAAATKEVATEKKEESSKTDSTDEGASA